METKSTLYNEFPFFLKRYFPYKVQKISLNAGFTCPNRDGNKGVGGCTYCNNQTFNPDYCRTEKSITRQLEEGKQFFAHKYPVTSSATSSPIAGALVSPGDSIPAQSKKPSASSTSRMINSCPSSWALSPAKEVIT